MKTNVGRFSENVAMLQKTETLWTVTVKYIGDYDIHTYFKQVQWWYVNTHLMNKNWLGQTLMIF
jgi:hypothetical protein